MPTLTIRNLPGHVHATLLSQALQDGLSVETEVRKILIDACISTVNLSEVAGRFIRDGIDATPII